MKILFVGDDSIGVDAVAVAISGLDAEFANVEDIEKAIDFLNSEAVNLVILDWDRPGVEGFNILRWIRTYRGSQPFVLLLTREILETELLRAFEAGADDYVMKPFRRLELAARINALLRRMVSTVDNKRHLQLGHYTVDFNRRLVYLRGQPITLTEKEFLLATILFNNVGKIVSRESIAKAVWGPTYNDFCRSMDTHVSRIRRKLALRAENGVRVKSVYTHGYTLTLSEPVSEKAEHTGDTEQNT